MAEKHKCELAENCKRAGSVAGCFMPGGCDGKVFSEKPVPDKFHYHEVMDRCHVLCSMIDDFLIGHDAVDDTAQEWCEIAQRALSSVSNRSAEKSEQLEGR